MTSSEFLANIIATRGQFGIPKTEYFEMHHIIPRCLGGLGDYDNGEFKQNSVHPNCIWLYPREHFIIHKLLAQENPKNPKLVWSWHAMWIKNGKERYEPTPEEYEERKILLHSCGLSEETKQKMSIANAGKNNGMYGKHHSDKTKEKLRQANLGKKLVWWTDGNTSTMATECPGPSWKRGRLGGFHDKQKRKITKIQIRKKYLWKLPDGTTKIMDKLNVMKWHPDWQLVKEID